MERYLENPSRTWLIPLTVVVLLLAGLWPALEVIGMRWLKFDESYSHGFLVLAVSIVLIVRKWLTVRPSVGVYPIWLIPLLAAAIVYLAGTLLLLEALQQIALLPLFVGALLLIWGWKQTTAFFLPLGLLIFTIPVWDYLSWPLQITTVTVNQFLLSWLGIEFTVEGVFVYFPGVGAFEIANGCSGLRYLLVGLTFSTLYGELNYQTLRSRFYLLVAGTLLALAANWIRVFVIIYIGYKSDMTSSLINEHDYFGWWVFAGTLVPLFFFARVLENREQVSSGVRESAADSQIQAPGWLSVSGVVFLPILLFSVAALHADARENMRVSGDSPGSLSPLLERNQLLPLFKSSIRGWHPILNRPDRSRIDVYLDRTNEGAVGEHQVEILTGLYLYESQRPGGELVHYNNRLYDRELFLPERTFEVNAGDGQNLRGSELSYRPTDVRVYVAYGYYVEGRWEVDELRAKLAQIPGIFNRRSDASLVVAGVACDGCDGQRVLNKLFPEVRENAQRQLDNLYKTGE